jgi:predicted transcriptional regulator
MKQAVNFRLNESTIHALGMLEQKLHCSKTAIVERALQFYAKRELTKQQLIMEYAGVLKASNAEEMLASIKDNKHNKKIQVQL